MGTITELQLRMNEAEREIEGVFARAGAKLGLSASAFDILYALDVYGDGCTQKELCERCWIGKQTVNSSVKRLMAQGVLEPVDPGARITRIELTDAGRALVAQSVHPFVEAEAAAFASFSPDEQAMLTQASERYRDALLATFAKAGLL